MLATEETTIAANEAANVPTSASSTVHRCEECGGLTITAPALRCSGCGEKHYLRCFVRQAGDTYVAECVDLDITAESSTVEGAIGGLQDAMCGYLAVVFDGGPNMDTRGLIPRLAPLSHRIRYEIYKAIARVFNPHGRVKTVYDFDVFSNSPC
jgi:hypothetical protein